MNQHDLTEVLHEKSQAWETVSETLLSNLKMSVHSADRILMCLDPCDNPMALTRCWCLYELYLCRTHNSEVIMKFNPGSTKAFFTSLKQNPDRVTDLISNLKVQDSYTSKQEDKAMILRNIEKEIGIDAFNDFLASEITHSLNIAGLEELYKTA
eukprot:gnl/MRDRNA2_/MRDRNA2_84615_c0_seq1.p1 gnl/MRDRNA2_/MRDRNA2_84615_c0~~gnl/MRDRNA2_/MRDRNA2_84615_c0_seq1.p1  ORF type:complete len:164 (+),score=26.16 gnl/MRDRNA2_/MRDRNA2_84615_c0_seq1:33-494(+)